MFSDIVVALALAGSARDRMPTDVDYSRHSATDSVEAPIRTREDVERFFTGDNLSYVFNALDTDTDGFISPRELAELELKGADVFSLVLSPHDAFVLADGAVREDGEPSTAYVPEEHIREWVVAAAWANLARVDVDGNGVLDDSELDLLATIDEEQLALLARAGPSDGAHVLVPHLEAADTGAVALAAAGEVLGRLENGPRRRYGAWLAYCWFFGPNDIYHTIFCLGQNKNIWGR